MALQIVTVTFDDKSDPIVDLEGFNGKGCAAVVEGFAKAVGQATSTTIKREFNAPVIAQNRLKQVR